MQLTQDAHSSRTPEGNGAITTAFLVLLWESSIVNFTAGLLPLTADHPAFLCMCLWWTTACTTHCSWYIVYFCFCPTADAEAWNVAMNYCFSSFRIAVSKAIQVHFFKKKKPWVNSDDSSWAPAGFLLDPCWSLFWIPEDSFNVPEEKWSTKYCGILVLHNKIWPLLFNRNISPTTAISCEMWLAWNFWLSRELIKGDFLVYSQI